jgi:hypothetical protein
MNPGFKIVPFKRKLRHYCAARLAPNHPHFIRLVTLVEEVYKSNRDVISVGGGWEQSRIQS